MIESRSNYSISLIKRVYLEIKLKLLIFNISKSRHGFSPNSDKILASEIISFVKVAQDVITICAHVWRLKIYSEKQMLCAI